MFHPHDQHFQREDRVALRGPYGSLPAGARGIVVEIHWSMEMCTVDFEGETIMILPWQLLEHSGETRAREVGSETPLQ